MCGHEGERNCLAKAGAKTAEIPNAPAPSHAHQKMSSLSLRVSIVLGAQSLGPHSHGLCIGSQGHDQVWPKLLLPSPGWHTGLPCRVCLQGETRNSPAVRYQPLKGVLPPKKLHQQTPNSMGAPRPAPGRIAKQAEQWHFTSAGHQPMSWEYQKATQKELRSLFRIPCASL